MPYWLCTASEHFEKTIGQIFRKKTLVAEAKGQIVKNLDFSQILQPSVDHWTNFVENFTT